MAKVLILKNKDFSSGFVKNNNGSKIAVYPDEFQIYTKDEFAALPEYQAIISEIANPTEKINEKMTALASKTYLQEQLMINLGIYELIYIEGSQEEVLKMFSDVHPQTQECWVDPDSGEVKILVERPQYYTKIVDGVISHNFNTDANSIVATGDSITRLTASKAVANAAIKTASENISAQIKE